MTTETLSVPDISCDHCQRTIESTLGRLPGVRAAAVDVATRTVRVTYDETALDHGRHRLHPGRRGLRGRQGADLSELPAIVGAGSHT